MANLIGMLGGVGVWLMVLSVWPTSRERKPVNEILDWPSFIEDVASGVRAGSALPNAMFLAGSRLPKNSAEIFSIAEEAWQIKGGFIESLRELSQSFPETGFQTFASTAELSYVQGGSSVPTVLSQLARSLRSRKQLENDVRARQATTVNSAKVAVIAPLIVLGLTSMRSEVREAYMNPTGVLVLVGIFCVTSLSYWLMIRTAKMAELDWIR